MLIRLLRILVPTDSFTAGVICPFYSRSMTPELVRKSFKISEAGEENIYRTGDGKVSCYQCVDENQRKRGIL